MDIWNWLFDVNFAPLLTLVVGNIVGIFSWFFPQRSDKVIMGGTVIVVGVLTFWGVKGTANQPLVFNLVWAVVVSGLVGASWAIKARIGPLTIVKKKKIQDLVERITELESQPSENESPATEVWHRPSNKIEKSLSDVKQEALAVKNCLADSTVTAPSIHRSLDYILDGMLLFGLHGANPDRFRICVAQPVNDCRFRMLGSRNVPSWRAAQLESEANWGNSSATFFGEGAHNRGPYFRESGGTTYSDTPPLTKEYKGTEYHCIIPLLNPGYESLPDRCLAVVTIAAFEKELVFDAKRVAGELSPYTDAMTEILRKFHTIQCNKD